MIREFMRQAALRISVAIAVVFVIAEVSAAIEAHDEQIYLSELK